jgi:hypothetical protein
MPVGAACNAMHCLVVIVMMEFLAQRGSMNRIACLFCSRPSLLLLIVLLPAWLLLQMQRR